MTRNQGNTLTLRWVPGNTDVEGNEMAGIRAKAAAQSEWVGCNDHLVATINLTHLQRKNTEGNKGGNGGSTFPLEDPGLEANCAESGRQLTGHAIIAL